MGRENLTVKEASIAEAAATAKQKVGDAFKKTFPAMHPAKHMAAKWGGRALLAGGLTAYGLERLSRSPTPMQKQAKPAKKAPDYKHQVRSDIKRYERQKLMKALYTGGALGSGAAAMIASTKGKKRLSYAGLGAAGISAVMRGHAKEEERSALNRVKRYYDLRGNQSLFSQEKTAVVGGALEAITGVLGALGSMAGAPIHGGFSEWIGSGLGHLNVPEVAQQLAVSTAPVAADLAFLPWVGKKVENSARLHAHIAAKQSMGLPLTPAEALLRAKSLSAVAKIRQTEAMPDGTLGKKVRQWFNKYRGPRATGGRLGEQAGNVLREVHKFSPTMAQAAVGAIKDNHGVEKLLKEVGQRHDALKEMGQLGEQLIDTVPGVRPLLRLSGRSGQNLLSTFAENPETGKAFMRKAIDVANRGVRGARTGLIAGGLIGAGSLLGQYRRRHPLSQNDLPSTLATSELKRKPGVMPPSSLQTDRETVSDALAALVAKPLRTRKKSIGAPS